MVPPASDKIPRVSPYSGSCLLPFACRLRGLHPLRPRFQSRSTMLHSSLGSPSTPSLGTVWAGPLSLAATQGIILIFFSCGYLDVSVPRVPLISLWIQNMMTDLLSAGFPHSDIDGSSLPNSSPSLFAVWHVLLQY